MRALRSVPPRRLAGIEVETEDLLPRTDGLRITGDTVKVVIRPSGTEPKLKCYAEVRLAATDELDAAKQTAALRLDSLLADLGTLLAQ